MKKIMKFIGVLLAVIGAFFAGTFTIYFFNLDMKLLAFLEPYLSKVYDLRKREKTL